MFFGKCSLIRNARMRICAKDGVFWWVFGCSRLPAAPGETQLGETEPEAKPVAAKQSF